ncbi:hypothetical protein KY366_06745 [Candidatus Woesearchaeota archaeon]|nr:hypothetical protein [Candidatus Woesearchaeota archaeon]
MVRKKRGQITVFIIIGLIILLTYILLSRYKTESLEEEELILPELIPVQQYVQTCTRNLAREAIVTMGRNGGYVDFPSWVQGDPNSYLKLSPNDELKNPYWWYDGRSAIPTIEFMEQQISGYTERGMEACIDNFSAFHNQYNVIELGSFDVITEIAEEDVRIKTIYPLEIKDKFNKTLAELQRFPVTINIRLKKVHQLAESIMERENNDYFIEKKAIDLISMDTDETPTTDIAVKCGTKRWEVSDVEDKVKELLEANLGYIKIEGTNFDDKAVIAPYIFEDINPFSESNRYNESYYYHHYIWDVSDVKYPNMHVSFDYDSKWPIDFYVRPSSGRFLESNSQRAGGILKLFCLHIWHFTYDVIFPVTATIVDEKTGSNERYNFKFAFKAQINHNMPDRTSFSVETFDTRGGYTDEEYCADVTNEITIRADDSITGYGIKDVNITFTCGRFTCNMGKTESDWESGGIPKLKKRFPYCTNGILRGTKQGYEEGDTFIQTGRKLGTDPAEQTGETFTFEMMPVKELNFSVVKHMMLSEDAISGEKGLKDSETAMVTVKNAQNDFESYSAYPSEANATLRLLAGEDFEYELQVIVMDKDEETGEERLSAGYEGEWKITKDDVKLGGNITFHVLGKEFEEEEEMYAFFAGLETYSEDVPMPKIK